MPHFKVHKGQDAYANYRTTVEADSVEEANNIACSRAYEGKWCFEGLSEFDDYQVFVEDTKEVEDLDDLFDMETVLLELSPMERDTMLASLRMWQASPDEARLPYRDISMNGREGAHADLTDEEIDDLCEEMNK